MVVSAQIPVERENSCDNLAIVATGDKKNLCENTAMFQIQQATSRFGHGYSSKKGVLQRIKRLQKK